MSDVSTKNPKRSALTWLILSAIVIGFLAGLGGSLILNHSLIRRPLVEQQQQIIEHNRNQEAQLVQLDRELANHHKELFTFQEELQRLFDDSTRIISRLNSVQNEYDEKEKEWLMRLSAIEQKLVRIETFDEEFRQTVLETKRHLDRSDKEISDDLRLLRNSLNDLENRLNQMQRQTSSN